MSSKGALKWLERLRQPRTIESLISEVYGQATWYSCLLEREVADLLNFYELQRNPIESLLQKQFNTKDYTLNRLIKEIEKRDFLSTEDLNGLRDAKDARNELVHELIARELVISRSDKEMFLAKIDALYFRVWLGHRFASRLKKEFADKAGITTEKVDRAIAKRREEAKIEDENLRRLLGDEPLNE